MIHLHPHSSYIQAPALVTIFINKWQNKWFVVKTNLFSNKKIIIEFLRSRTIFWKNLLNDGF